MVDAEHAGDASQPDGNRAQLRAGEVLKRLGAAALVALVAVGAKELILDSGDGRSDTKGAKVREIGVRSELLDAEIPVNVVVPKGAFDGKRGLVVFLHGRDEDESSNLDQELFGALARLKGKAPVMAFPGGSEDSYWHDRESGPWGSFVLDELIPRLTERFEIEPERIAIGGISMGGFGAYNLSRQRPQLFCAVGGHSPALWLNGGDTAPGAFDDEADFEANDVIAALRPGGADSGALDGLASWLDIGQQDSFLEATTALADAIDSGSGRHSFRTEAGDHDHDYWRSNWRSYTRFYGTALKACGDAERERQAAAKAAQGDADEDEAETLQG